MSDVSDFQVLTIFQPANGPFVEGQIETVHQLESGTTPQPGHPVITGADGMIDPTLIHRSATDITFDNTSYPTVEDALNYLVTEVQTLAGEIPLPATEVTYDNPSYPTVEAALNFLLYIPIQLLLTNDQNTLEIGQTANEVTLTWTINKTVVSQSIDNGVGSIDPTLRTYQITIPSPGLSTNRTYTLTVNDGTRNGSASTSVLFENKAYWGASALTSLTTSDILALSNQAFATSRQRSVTYNCSATAYPYYCYPAAWGAPSNVMVGGLAFSDFTATQQSFTNAHGHTSSYYVVRFNNIQTGANIAVTWG